MKDDKEIEKFEPVPRLYGIKTHHTPLFYQHIASSNLFLDSKGIYTSFKTTKIEAITIKISSG